MQFPLSSHLSSVSLPVLSSNKYFSPLLLRTPSYSLSRERHQEEHTPLTPTPGHVGLGCPVLPCLSGESPRAEDGWSCAGDSPCPQTATGTTEVRPDALYSPALHRGGGWGWRLPRVPTEGKPSQLGSLDVLAIRVRGLRSAPLLSRTLQTSSSRN